MFWTDGRFGVVEVKSVKEDGIRKTVAKRRETPRALAVNPVTGYGMCVCMLACLCVFVHVCACACTCKSVGLFVLCVHICKSVCALSAHL